MISCETLLSDAGSILVEQLAKIDIDLYRLSITVSELEKVRHLLINELITIRPDLYLSYSEIEQESISFLLDIYESCK